MKYEQDKKVVLLKEVEDWVSIQNRYQNAVVQVVAQIAAFNWLQPYTLEDQTEQLGTGFFINDQGLIVTSAHVIDEAATVWVYIPALGLQKIPVNVVGFCPSRDLALLQVDDDYKEMIRAELGEIQWLPIGDSDAVNRTDKLLALGYPLGQTGLKSSTGVVSGHELIEGMTFIQVTTPVNMGNSGGPVINEYGEVVGIAAASVVTAQSIGYAIPINVLKSVMDDMLEQTFLRTGMLGVQFCNGSDYLANYFGNPQPSGLYMYNILKGSFAEKLGLKCGDVLYSFNGIPVDAYGQVKVSWRSDKSSITDLISRLHLGQEVSVVVYRAGKRHEFSAPFAEHEPLPIRFIYPKYEPVDYEIIGGLVVMQLVENHFELLLQVAPDLVNYAKANMRDQEVLVVTHVLPGSYAQQYGSVGVGDVIAQVNDHKVSSLEQFRHAVIKSGESDFLTISTEDNLLMVLPFRAMLEDEERLAQAFMCPMTSTVKALIKKYLAKHK